MKFDFTREPGKYIHDRGYTKEYGIPLISIVTPFYNAKNYIEQTFNCVQNQTFPWFEWIIVDDGSEDEESVNLLHELAARDSRIKLYHQENAGPAVARNYGFDMATTDFVFPLDSDDLIEPTCLEYEYWALYFNPEASWAYTDCVGFQEKEYTWQVPFDSEKMKTENHLNPTALIRKSHALKVGGYSNITRNFDEDWHFWLKILAEGGYPVQIKNDFLFWYRCLNTGRFAAVHGDKDTEDENKRIIAEQADFVINPHEAVIYPKKNLEGKWEAPILSMWDRKLFEKHDKIHIAFLIPWMQMGGADKFNIDLIKGLNKDEYDIGVLTTVPSENDWIQEFREYVDDIFNLPNFLDPHNFAEFISYYIKSREVDVLFLSNSYHGYYLLPWLRKNFPDLVILDYVHMEEWYWRAGGYARTSGALGDIIDKTYVCNSATRNVLIEQFDRIPESVATAYIGVDEKRFDATRIKGGVLQEYGIEQDRPVVLFICRLHYQKRPYMMIEIANRVREKIPNVAFAVVGDGELMEPMMEKVQAMNLENTVYFLGAHKEVRPFYKDAKISLICSLKEGLALTAYESCAMGVPVVTANVGGQKDLIDESVGALINCRAGEADSFGAKCDDYQEIQEYVDAIVRILSDAELYSVMSRKCRAKIESGFTIDNMVQYFKKEIQEQLSRQDLIHERKKKSEALNMLGKMADDYFSIELMEQWAEEAKGLRYYSHQMNCKNRTNAQFNEEQMETLYYVTQMIEEHTKVLNRHEEVVNRHEEVVNRHEEVVNRHEEVVNRHEEVVNRHEVEINIHNDKINHQWEIQNWHEERISAIEQKKMK